MSLVLNRADRAWMIRASALIWLGVAWTAPAALIAWEGATDTTGNAALDVRTNGTVLVAVNMGPSTIPAITLNGVLFPPVPAMGC